MHILFQVERCQTSKKKKYYFIWQLLKDALLIHKTDCSFTILIHPDRTWKPGKKKLKIQFIQEQELTPFQFLFIHLSQTKNSF